MRTTMDLPDSVMRAVKIRAAEEGRKLKDVMEELIRRGLRDTGSAPAPSRRKAIAKEPVAVPVNPRAAQSAKSSPTPKATAKKLPSKKATAEPSAEDESVIDSSFPL